jgi:hypothetical protein
MSHHDDSLLDKVKGALGFGDAHEREPHDGGVDMEQPPDDASPEAVEPIGQIDGAAHVAARQGVGGGTGATAGLNGAGAAGPAGVTGLEPDAPDAAEPTADPGDVKTEYEMGHERPIPEHERVAESGVSRDPEDRVQP